MTRIALPSTRERAMRLPFNYRWVVVVLAALAMTATLPGRTHGLGLITEPLLADLKVEHTLFGRINLVTCLLGTAFCLPAGFLLDRFGIRVATSGTVLALGLSVLGMATAESAFALTLWLVLVRGVGQSALSIVSMAAVGKWFRGRQLGIAMGLYAVLLTFGFIGSVVWLGSAVEKQGWRTAWSNLGWILLIGMLPLSLLLAREAPKDHSDATDGGGADVADSQLSGSFSHLPVDFTFRHAVGTPAFWVFALGAGAFNLVWSALTLFNQSILEERGFDSHVAINVMAILVGTGLLSNLVGGALARRERIGWLLGAGLAILALSLFCFPRITTTAALMVYAGGIGIAGGLVTVIFFAAWSSVFGRAQVGRIQGLAQLICGIASALGPDLIAEGRALGNSYSPAFYAMAATTAALALGAFFVRVPGREASEIQEVDAPIVPAAVS